MKSTISRLLSKLRNPEYRKAYVASQINIGIPFQVRALMKSHDLTQEKLAERTGMLQPRISKLLNPGAMEPNIRTLRRIAEAFDCGLMVRFVPFSELVLRSERFDPEAFRVPTFGQEAANGTLDHLGNFLTSDDLTVINQSVSVYDRPQEHVKRKVPDNQVRRMPQRETEPIPSDLSEATTNAWLLSSQSTEAPLEANHG